MSYTRKVDDEFISYGLNQILDTDTFLQNPNNQLSLLSFYLKRDENLSDPQSESDFDGLFKGDNPITLPSVTKVPKIEASGEKSAFLPVRVAMGILNPYLKSFGVPNPENLADSLKAAGRISFSFSNLNRKGYSREDIKKTYESRTLDTDNGVVTHLLETPMPELLLVYSIVKGNSFSIHVKKTGVDLAGIKTEINNQNPDLSVEINGENTLIFTHSKELVFAFGSIPCVADEATKVLILDPGKGKGSSQGSDGGDS